MRFNKFFKIGLIIVDIIALILIAFSYIKLNSNKENEKKDEQVNETSDKNIDYYTSVNFNNFVIKLPSGYKYKYDDKKSNSIIIFTDVGSEVAYIEQFENKDTNFMDKYETIADNLRKNNYEVDNAVKKTYNGKDIIVMDYNDKSAKDTSIIAYVAINDQYKAEITIYGNEKNKLSEYLETILDILATAEKNK